MTGNKAREHPYLPSTPDDRAAMLKTIGVSSVEELFADIPAAVRYKGPLEIPPALSEMDLLDHLQRLAAANADAGQYTSYLGGGVYDHYIPSVVDKLISRGEFATSYTPYQAEISQGNLQAIYEFQTMICELTGMDVANASMYDGASATAEAALMAVNHTGRERIVIAQTVHPETRRVVKVYTETQNLQVEEVAWQEGAVAADALASAVNDQTACVILQVPNFFGVVENPAAVAELAHQAGAVLIAVCDPISLGVLESPGAYGADIAVGEGQALGNAVSYGGPHFGFLAARQKYLRRMPGRIVGATVDNENREGYVLTLQTREQHIRRERATSNICTNQALMALAATVYMATVGKQGFQEVADLCLQKSHYLKEQLGEIERFEPAFPHQPFFKEFVIRSKLPVPDVLAELQEQRILGGLALAPYYPDLADCFLVAVTEKRTRAELDHFVARLEAIV
ncbi:MAG: aminomethyl-transferring glycine dehydrogenase subunit GcvPA [Thermaerobacterales bacterium]